MDDFVLAFARILESASPGDPCSLSRLPEK